MMGKPYVVLLLLALFGAIAGAVHASTNDIADAMDAVANELMASGNAAGLALGVSYGADTVIKGYGMADLEHEIPVSADTIFQIGSITKTFTALAILQLVEAGKVNLDDTIQTYLPDYDAHGETITIHHLLTHTSGIPNYTSIVEDSERWMLDQTHEQMRAVFEPKELDFKPGTAWSYSNSGYYLLGLVIEKVTGQDYATYIQENICTPAGLNQTSYGSRAAVVKGRSEGYVTKGDAFAHARDISMTVPYAAGAMMSTAGDLLRFADALVAAELLASESLTQMVTPAPLVDGTQHGYAYGVMSGTLDGHTKHAHEGGIDGFVAQLAHYPDDDLTIAVLINCEAANAPVVERALARKLLGIAPFEAKDLPLSEAEIARYTGAFSMGQELVEISERRGKLRLAIEGFLPIPLELRHQGDGLFVTKLDPDIRVRYLPTAEAAEQLHLKFGDMELTLSRQKGDGNDQ